MQYLKTIFWVLVALIFALFVSANNRAVELTIWGDQKMAIAIWALIVIVFTIGFLPTMLYYRAKVWRLKRRLELTERNIAQAPLTPPPPSAPPRTTAPQPSSPFESQ